MIQVENISRRFVRGLWPRRQQIQAVQDANLRADNSRITGLLGPNGAGKTTTLRIVAGLVAPDAGQVYVDSIDVAQDPRAALAHLGVLCDSRGLYPRLSARENIVYHARLHGMDAPAAEARAKRLAEMLDMGELMERRCEGFSQGERMKTALARALVHDPANIVLDEPTNGLDVLATRALRKVLRRLRDEENKCIIVSTHIMQEVELLCDHVVVMSKGRTVAHGTVEALKAKAGAPSLETAFVRLAFSAEEQLKAGEADARKAGAA